MDNIDYKKLMLEFFRSLYLCDHMGDVANNVDTVLKRMGLEFEWDDLSDLGKKLSKQGVKHMREDYYGEWGPDDDDDDDDDDDPAPNTFFKNTST